MLLFLFLRFPVIRIGRKKKQQILQGDESSSEGDAIGKIPVRPSKVEPATVCRGNF